MDAKLNPIASSSAGTPLMGKSVAAGSGRQAKTNANLTNETVQDTLETSDREVDGRQPYQAPSADAHSEEEPTQGQGGLLDLQG